MGRRLAIRRVSYKGARFTFSSPLLPDGLVVIEGPNGAGKTTFADLVYFGLGGTVPHFAATGSNRHKEIVSDSDNSVVLDVEIQDHRYSLTRSFESPADIVVIDQHSEVVEILAVDPRNRRLDRKIFSDWLLEQLGIEVVTLYSGGYSGKVNFTDLMRLIYHDQSPDPTSVFKKVDKQSFVTDSREFRRAVFEILIGRASEDYYRILGLVRDAEKALSEARSSAAAFAQLARHSLRGRDDANADALRVTLQEVVDRVQRLESRRQTMLAATLPEPGGTDDVRERLTELELNFTEATGAMARLLGERVRLVDTREEFISEATRIQKILVTQDRLGLFDRDTCPCCLRSVERELGHCICGLPIDETTYQKHFYGKDEYVALLKSRQKSVQTIDKAIESCEREKDDLAGQLMRQEAERGKLRAQLTASIREARAPDLALRELDSTLLEQRSLLDQLQQQLEIEIRRDALEAMVARAEVQRTELSGRLAQLETKAREDIGRKLDAFNRIYSGLLRRSIKEIRQARLGPDYMPEINNGEYREASATVAVRLMYYATLLALSLSHEDVSFPQFLLVDTPETAGIDAINLIAALTELCKILVGDADVTGANKSSAVPKERGQVILTTGLGKYPQHSATHVVLTLSGTARLLVPKTQETA